MSNASLSCTILAQLQRLFCWQMCPFFDVIAPGSSQSLSPTSTFLPSLWWCTSPSFHLLLSWYDRNFWASLLQLSSIIVFLLLLPIYPHFVGESDELLYKAHNVYSCPYSLFYSSKNCPRARSNLIGATVWLLIAVPNPFMSSTMNRPSTTPFFIDSVRASSWVREQWSPSTDHYSGNHPHWTTRQAIWTPV